MKRQGFLGILLIIGLLFVPACKKTTSGSDSGNDSGSNVYSVTITPASAVKNVGGTQQYTAVATDAGGNEIGSATFTWASSDTSVVTVNESGVATGQGGGNGKITVTCDGKRAEGVIFINPQNSTHNCREIEWYKSQDDTGTASNNNCGPASVHMAIKWYRNTTANIPTVQDIRDLHPNDGGWWYTYNITDTLYKYKIPWSMRSVSSKQDILDVIARGDIAILCVEMKWMTYNRHAHYDRFYSYASGHFMVLKGKSNDNNYVICYDSNAYEDHGDYYEDGTCMGRNRYYNATETLDAVTNWWAWLIEVGDNARIGFPAEAAQVPPGKAGPN